jgi:cyclase
MKMRKCLMAVLWCCGLSLVFTTPSSAGAQGQGVARVRGQLIAGKVYSFEKIADGVYYTTSDGPFNVGGNHAVIVGDRNVLLVDAGTTTAAARALLEDIKLITDKPVRWVINTHFHYDHTDGNSIFGPEVEIIGQDYVRHAMADLDVTHREPMKLALTNMPAQVESLKKQIAEEKNVADREALQKKLAAAQADLEDIKTVKITPPNVTYSSKMTLYQGSREIQLLFLGRGHTQGDTVVYLPKERIVCTGDLMESRIAYMGDGLFDEWITTLDALKELNFDTVLPGHGVPFHEKSLITAFQSYLKDFMVKVAELRKQGLSPEETAQKIDMTSHQSDFPLIQGPGAEVRSVRRMYEYLDERAKR